MALTQKPTITRVETDKFGMPLNAPAPVAA